MRIIRVIKWAGILLVAAIAVAIAILHSIDVDGYRDEIAAGFAKATGWSLSIDGKIDLSLSLNPAVVVEDVSVANADWGTRPRMMTLRRAEARVELLPLLAGDVRVTKLVLVEPDILLETSSDGVANWRPGPPSDGGTVEAGDGISRIPMFSHVDIRRGTLTYRDGRSGEEVRLDLAEAALEARPASESAAVEITGAWNGVPFTVSGSVEPLASLGSGLPLRLVVEVEGSGFDARLAGAISDPHEFEGLDLEVEATGSSLASLAAVAGPDIPDLGPVDLRSVVRGSAEKLEIGDLRLALASSDFAGAVTVSRITGRPHVAGKLVSTAIDLSELLREPEGEGSESARGSPKSDEARPGRVFPDDPLSLEGLAAVDLDLDLTVDRLVAAPLPLRDVRARVLLENGVMTVTPLSFSVAQSRIDGEARLGSGANGPALALAMNAPDLDVGGLLRELDVSDFFEGRANVDVVLAGAGESVAALLAGMNGEVRVVASEGRLQTRAIDTVVGGASAVLGTLVAGTKQWTVVNCAVSSVDIEDGVATSRATLIDTEHSTIAATGTIDLASETLDLIVEPKAKSVTLNVAVPVHVRGPLADPVYLPETGATLRKLGGLLGLAVFPPAAIAGLAELGSGDNECVRIATATRDTGPTSGSQSGPAVPGIPASTVEKIEEGAEDLLEGISEGLKGIFGRGD